MSSSQSLTIMKTDEKITLVVGSPGGRTIINTVTQILIQTRFFDCSITEAIDGPRFHHQWLPDIIKFEADDRGLFTKMSSSLKKIGHTIEQPAKWRQDSAHAIAVDTDSKVATGVANWQRGGAARAVTDK